MGPGPEQIEKKRKQQKRAQRQLLLRYSNYDTGKRVGITWNSLIGQFVYPLGKNGIGKGLRCGLSLF